MHLWESRASAFNNPRHKVACPFPHDELTVSPKITSFMRRIQNDKARNRVTTRGRAECDSKGVKYLIDHPDPRNSCLAE
jgi:hypothetical protein